MTLPGLPFAPVSAQGFSICLGLMSGSSTGLHHLAEHAVSQDS